MDVFVGEEYGDLIVTEFVGITFVGGDQKYLFKCECICGGVIERRGDLLKGKTGNNCGCHTLKSQDFYKGCTNFLRQSGQEGFSIWRRLLTRRNKEVGFVIAPDVLDFKKFQEFYKEEAFGSNKIVIDIKENKEVTYEILRASVRKILLLKEGEYTSGVLILKLDAFRYVTYKCNVCKKAVKISRDFFVIKKDFPCTCERLINQRYGRSVYSKCTNYAVKDNPNDILLVKWRRMVKSEGEIDNSWSDYHVFKEYASGYQYNIKDIICRKDVTKPFQPDNIKFIPSHINNNYKGMKVNGVECIDVIGRRGVRSFLSILKCFCGRNYNSTWHYFKKGASKSCGCTSDTAYYNVTPLNTCFNYQKELHTDIFGRYRTLINRGGVCKEWLDFKVFQRWCEKVGVNPSTTFLRRDVTKPHSPLNTLVAENNVGLKIGGSKNGMEIINVDGESLTYRCFCGKESKVKTKSYTSNNVKSCGCKKGVRSSQIRLNSNCKNYAGKSTHRHYKKWINLSVNKELPEVWFDFNVFVKFVEGLGCKQRIILTKIDKSLPHSPENTTLIGESPDHIKELEEVGFKNIKKGLGNNLRYQVSYTCICGRKREGVNWYTFVQKKKCNCSSRIINNSYLHRAKSVSGRTDHPHYQQFCNAIRRGGVCEEWLDFDVFAEFMEGNKDKEGKSPLKRIDTNKPHSPENVKIWKKI